MTDRKLSKFSFVGTFDRFSVGDEGVLLRSFENDLQYDRTIILDDKFARELMLRYPSDDEETRLKRVKNHSVLGSTAIANKEQLGAYIAQNSEDTLLIVSAYEETFLRVALLNFIKPSGIIVRVSAGDENTKERYEKLKQLNNIEKERVKELKGQQEK